MSIDSDIKVIESTITISLPLWVRDEKYDRQKVFFYSKYHAWAGSYDRTTYDNVISEELFDLESKGISILETMFHPMNCWVNVNTNDVPINEVLEMINEVVQRFTDEDYTKEATKTVYYNKPE